MEKTSKTTDVKVDEAITEYGEACARRALQANGFHRGGREKTEADVKEAEKKLRKFLK
jgi:hypothetical protein